MNLYLTFAILVFVLQLADWWTTRLIIRRGGYERNPVVAWLMRGLGVDGALLVKVLFVVAIMYAASKLVTHPNAWLMLPPLIFLYSWIVGSNIRVLKSLSP